LPVSTITSKGQITIPKEVREHLTRIIHKPGEPAEAWLKNILNAMGLLETQSGM
jgi:hypothetical protein